MTDNTSFQKLQLFFNYSNRGFLLLTVNEWNKTQQIQALLKKQLHPEFFNMAVTEYNTILNNMNSVSPKSMVFSGFDKSDDFQDLLEKFNLGRDIFLQKNKYCIFIVPLYIELYIQEQLPNLYAYFEFKEQFLTSYKNYCEFILPEDEYLKTKSMQKILKDTLIHSDNTVLQRLDGYMHIRINHTQYKQLEEDLYTYINKIKKETSSSTNMQSANNAFCNKLLMSLARLATIQGEYRNALNIYEQLISKMSFTSPQETYELLNNMSDAYLYSEDYKKAQRCYSKILEFLFEEYNNDTFTEEQFQNAKTCTYSKLALCEFKMHHNTKVLEYIRLTLLHIPDLSEESREALFPIYYNYFLMYLDIFSERTIEGDKLFQELENFDKKPMQNSMFLTIKAWYLGIINGDLSIARQLADNALQIKRQICIENDSRIAESHYVNAMIRMFQGNYTEAQNCCIKSINILKNFPLHTAQKEASQKLLKQIQTEEIG